MSMTDGGLLFPFFSTPEYPFFTAVMFLVIHVTGSLLSVASPCSREFFQGVPGRFIIGFVVIPQIPLVKSGLSSGAIGHLGGKRPFPCRYGRAVRDKICLVCANSGSKGVSICTRSLSNVFFRTFAVAATAAAAVARRSRIPASSSLSADVIEIALGPWLTRLNSSNQCQSG